MKLKPKEMNMGCLKYIRAFGDLKRKSMASVLKEDRSEKGSAIHSRALFARPKGFYTHQSNTRGCLSLNYDINKNN